jgi:hypothetical protein
MQILLYRNFLLKKKSPFLTWIRIQLEVPYPYVGVSKGDSSLIGIISAPPLWSGLIFDADVEKLDVMFRLFGKENGIYLFFVINYVILQNI